MPIIRYLSNLLLNRITFIEREAFTRLISEINNELPHDRDYESGEPSRNVEALKTWEAIAHLDEQLIKSDVNESLSLLDNAINRADATYTNLGGYGLSVDIEASREYISSLREGIQTFKRNAEI